MRSRGTGTGSHKLRRGLIIGEFGLALSLLAGAGLAIHSFWNLTRLILSTNRSCSSLRAAAATRAVRKSEQIRSTIIRC